MLDLQNETVSEIYGDNQKAQLKKWIAPMRWAAHEQCQKDFSKFS